MPILASRPGVLAENFFSTLEVERVYRTSYRTHEEAELDLFRSIDGWYNPHRCSTATCLWTVVVTSSSPCNSVGARHQRRP